MGETHTFVSFFATLFKFIIEIIEIECFEILKFVKCFVKSVILFDLSHFDLAHFGPKKIAGWLIILFLIPFEHQVCITIKLGIYSPQLNIHLLA